MRVFLQPVENAALPAAKAAHGKHFVLKKKLENGNYAERGGERGEPRLG
jgi:hypothetical protein